MRQRILINNYGPDKEKLKCAIQCAFSIALRENKKISIVVPNMNNLDGVVEEVLGKDFIRKIKKGSVNAENIEMNLLTDVTMSKKERNSIFLCLYTTPNMMSKISNYNNIDYEIYLPWMEQDVISYRKWNPQII